MTPRLMHTKSRSGCVRCKVRKVKCDEVKPVCGACRKHGVDCAYPATPPASTSRAQGQQHRRRRSRTPNSSSGGRSGPPDSPGAAVAVHTLIPGVVHDEDGISLPESRDRRLLELRMLGLWMRSFRDMFSAIHSSTLIDVWQNTVPALAIDNPFLMHAMFAITALYSIVTRGGRPSGTGTGTGERCVDGSALAPASVSMPGGAPTPASSENASVVAPGGGAELPIEIMEEVRILYFNLAIGGHRKAISNLNPTNADSACISTILISNSGFLLTHDFKPDAATYAPPVNWLWLAAGIPTIISETTPMLAEDSATMRIIQGVSGDSANDMADLPNSGAFFAPLLEWERHTETEADLAIYSRVLDLMGLIRIGLLKDQGTSQRLRRSLSFASIIPTEYISFVSDHRPRALAILACFFAMVKENEEIWWFRGAAEMHVLGLKTLLPASWMPLLDWPLNIINIPSPGQRMALYQQEKMTAPI